MKITGIQAFPVTYTVRNGGFRLSGGRRFTHFKSVIIRIDTDTGLSGWGEHASSAQYMVAHHESALAVLAEIAPALIGLDPRQNRVIHAAMERTVRGHAYARTAIDIACWDLAGKDAGVPVAVLLGGIHQPDYPRHKMVIMDTPEKMRDGARAIAAAGFRTLQVKVGNDWREDVERVEACLETAPLFDRIVVDANGNYSPGDALHLINATRQLNYVIEQPCRTLEDNLSLRRRIERPMVLDESLDSLEMVFRAHAADGFDQAMLKLSRFGGIGPTAFVRDLCTAWNRPVTMEDMSGGGIVAAAAAHLAASTPAGILAAGSYVTDYVEETNILGSWPQDGQGHLPSDQPGLGIVVDEAAIGSPVWSVQ